MSCTAVQISLEVSLIKVLVVWLEEDFLRFLGGSATVLLGLDVSVLLDIPISPVSPSKGSYLEESKLWLRLFHRCITVKYGLLLRPW